MRALIQRVSSASVSVDQNVIAQISRGLLVYVGVWNGDTVTDCEQLAAKIRYLRIFPDDAGKSNLDVSQVAGAILAVSNFSLAADTSQGRRPAFTTAAPPAEAEALFDKLCTTLQQMGMVVQTGRFAAEMEVYSVNDGPMNFVIETRRMLTNTPENSPQK